MLTSTLGGLAILALVLLSGSGAAQATPADPASDGAEMRDVAVSALYTANLPVVMGWYDPEYVYPLGIRMSGDVDEASGLLIMKDAGARWVTTNFYWSAIEYTQGAYGWSSFDEKALNAQQAGMDVLAMFTRNPPWAASLPGGPVTDIQDLVNITTRMAERYDCDGVDDAPGSPCVHYWSFYAEPDNGDLARAQLGKGYWGHNGAGYAAMLAAITPGMRAANPQVQVFIGGIAYDYFEEDGGPFVRPFLADTLRALNQNHGGVSGNLDGVAFHYYPISANRWPTIREKTQEIRGIMGQNSASSLSLVCPEAAYWSSPNFGSSDARQAQRIVQMYVRAASVDVRPTNWYQILDTAWAGGPDDTTPDRTGGLLYLDGTPKPAYTAYQVVARELGVSWYLRQFSHPGVEGYVFHVTGNREKTVLWGQSGDVNVPFTGACMRVVTRSGSEVNVPDGDPTNDVDGTVNGQVTLRVRENEPIYVEPCH
jgi:hypothetical protein